MEICCRVCHNPDLLLQLLTLIGYEKPLNACLLFEIDFQITYTLQGNLSVIPTAQKFGLSKIYFFFFKGIDSFIQQGCIKLTLSDIKNIFNSEF